VQRRLDLLEGLPEAAALVGNSGDGTGNGGSSKDHVDVVQDLMLAPVAWCFKVRRRRRRSHGELIYSCPILFEKRSGDAGELCRAQSRTTAVAACVLKRGNFALAMSFRRRHWKNRNSANGETNADSG